MKSFASALRAVSITAVSVLVCLATSASAQPPLQPGDGVFDWPVGLPDDSGRLVLGRGYYLQQNFGNLDGPSGLSPSVCRRAHAGIDFQRTDNLLGAGEDVTGGQTVYAVADGRVLCAPPDLDYPGRAVVIQHLLPDGRTFYSTYGHLTPCDPDVDAPCVGPGENVARGQAIGTIYAQSTSNSHLHFEIRTFPYWDLDTERPTSTPPAAGEDPKECPGRGYAAPPAGTALDPGYLNPIDFILEHRAATPANVRARIDGGLVLQSEPVDTAFPVDLGGNGQPPRAGGPWPDPENGANWQGELDVLGEGTEVRVLAVLRDPGFQCSAVHGVDTESELDYFTDQHGCTVVAGDPGIGDDCRNGACDWWYHVEIEGPAGSPPRRGYVKAFEKSYEHYSLTKDLHWLRGNSYRSTLLVDPVVEAGTVWQDPLTAALVDFSFDEGQVAGRTVPNAGSVAEMDGTIVGGFVHDTIFPELPVVLLDWAIWLDGGTGYLEVAESAQLGLEQGFQLDLRVRRESLGSTDVLASQWAPGAERWILRLAPEDPAAGRHYEEIQLVVALAGGGEKVARFGLPDCRHVRRWLRISASYDPADDQLRLYRDGVLLDRIALEGARIAPGQAPLRLGSDGSVAGNDGDRLHGGLAHFRFWSEPPVITSPYPYGISRVETDPVAIRGQKDLDKLFDGRIDWPQTAVIHYVPHADVGVEMEFVQPVTLEGFRVAVAGIDFGGDGNGRYLWQVQTATSWGGPFTTILSDFETDSRSGTGVVRLNGPISAKVFKLIADRANGDGIVHLLEIEPLTEVTGTQYPHGIVRVDTIPAAIDGQRELDKLFDGQVVWPATAIIHYVPDADVAVQFEFEAETDVEAFRVSVAGADFEGDGGGSYLWRVETAPDWDGPFTTVVSSYETDSSEVMASVPLGGVRRAKVFRVTADRNNGDGVVHWLELQPVIDPPGPPADLIPLLDAGQSALIQLADLVFEFLASQQVGILTVERIEGTPLRLAGPEAFLGHRWEIEATVDDGSFEALVSFPYTDAELAAAGVAEPTLRVYSFDTAAGEWREEELVTHDQNANLITVRTDHFSTWALGGAFNAAPDCSLAAATPAELLVPNHTFKPIAIVGVEDPDGDLVTLWVDAIFQDEAVDAPSSGATCPDADGVGTANPRVLAERSYSADGRVYHLFFTATDGRGGSCTGEVTVGVPHRKKGLLIDGGALFDSTLCP